MRVRGSSSVVPGIDMNSISFCGRLAHAMLWTGSRMLIAAARPFYIEADNDNDGSSNPAPSNRYGV
jgi:hypothetical protein